MENNKHEIDKKAQELFENFEVPYNPKHWEQMTQQLNALDAAESSFDSIIRQQLENTTPDFKGNHWDLMSKQLDDLNNDDATFDASIREKLDKIHRTYQPKHWELMSQRIEQEFSWKAKIMRYKVVEVALMLLLLFTVFNYFDIIGDENNAEFKASKSRKIENPTQPKSFNQGTDWRIRENKSENKSNKDSDKKQDSAQPPIVSIDNYKIEKQTLEISSVVNNQVLTNQESSVKSLENTFYTEGGNYRQLTNVKGIDSDQLAQNTEGGDATMSNRKIDIAGDLPILKVSELGIVQQELDILLIEKSKADVAASEPVKVLRPNALTIAQLYETPDVPKMAKKDKWWRLGVFGSGSLNNVSSSYVYKDTKNWNFWSLSKGIGLTAGVRKKKIELDMGLSYTTINYRPDLPEAILEGRIVTGLAIMPKLTKEVSLGILKLPVNLNIHFADKKRWHIYTVTGIAAHAAFKIDTTNYAPLSYALAKASQRSSNDTDFPAYGKPFKISIEKPENNFYFTANLGMGVEFKITPRYSAYIQPQYEHHFSRYGIGSKSDKIDVLSVQAGLKMQLGSTSIYKY